MQSNKVLKELRFLECSGTDINKNLLEQILNSHDNLQQVAAISEFENLKLNFCNNNNNNNNFRLSY